MMSYTAAESEAEPQSSYRRGAGLLSQSRLASGIRAVVSVPYMLGCAAALLVPGMLMLPLFLFKKRGATNRSNEEGGSLSAIKTLNARAVVAQVGFGPDHLAPKLMAHLSLTGPGLLGSASDAFRHTGPSRGDLTLQGITYDRLSDRAKLLTSFDNFRRDVDASGKMDAMDTFTQQAMGVLTSSKLADALDLSKEDPRLVERYARRRVALAFLRREEAIVHLQKLVFVKFDDGIVLYNIPVIVIAHHVGVRYISRAHEHVFVVDDSELVMLNAIRVAERHVDVIEIHRLVTAGVEFVDIAHDALPQPDHPLQRRGTARNTR